jgi:3',5'-cyclic AMP phosphodiesterase CpdA
MTWNLNDMAVKGHLPAAEVTRVRKIFDAAPPGTAKYLVVHHNVLPGQISRRMGLAHWRRAQRQIVDSGADVVLCGHDHQEGVDQLDGRLVVSTASTHTGRTRGRRAAAFNVVRVEPEVTEVRHLHWESGSRRFVPASVERFARNLAP